MQVKVARIKYRNSLKPYFKVLHEIFVQHISFSKFQAVKRDSSIQILGCA